MTKKNLSFGRAVLNKEKISTVIHAKDVNRKGAGHPLFVFCQLFHSGSYLHRR
jgi:hypothetical protein